MKKMFNKRGVVSLTTYSFIIMILILISLLSYSYYSSSKIDSELVYVKQEVLNSVGSFRGQMLNLVVYNDSNMSYSSYLDSDDIQIELITDMIVGSKIYDNQLVEVKLSSLGINFCSNYTFYPAISKTFTYNGSCVSMN